MKCLRNKHLWTLFICSNYFTFTFYYIFLCMYCVLKYSITRSSTHFFLFFYFDLFLFNLFSSLSNYSLHSMRCCFFLLHIYMHTCIPHRFSHDTVSRSFYFFCFYTQRMIIRTHTHRYIHVYTWSISKLNFCFVSCSLAHSKCCFPIYLLLDSS